MTQPVTQPVPVPDLRPSPALNALNAKLRAVFGPELRAVRIQTTEYFGEIRPVRIDARNASGELLIPEDIAPLRSTENNAGTQYLTPGGDWVANVTGDGLQDTDQVESILEYLFDQQRLIGYTEAETWFNEIGVRRVIGDDEWISVPLLTPGQEHSEQTTALLLREYLLDQDVLQGAEEDSDSPDFRFNNATKLGQDLAALLHRGPFSAQAPAN